MSNPVTIEPTMFTDVRSGVVSYGYRVFDSYDKHYENTWESIPDDDMEVLRMVLTDAVDSFSEVIIDMFQSLLENENGLEIGDTFYDFEDIKKILIAILG